MSPFTCTHRQPCSRTRHQSLLVRLLARSTNCLDENGDDGWRPGARGVSPWPVDAAGVLKALPLITFAMQAHIQSAAVFVELPARLQHSARARRGIAVGATVVVLSLYLPAGIAGFARFGDATNADILYNFGSADYAGDVAKVCMGLTALATFPCQHFPARIVLHKLWWRACSRSRVSVGGSESPPPLTCAFALCESFLWTLATLGTTIVAIFNGIKLDLVFQLIGSVCGSAVILIIPGLLWVRFGSGKPGSTWRLLPSILLPLVGGVVMVAGTLVTVQEMLQAKHK
jgi:hypothetical protein